ncbi:MAG: CRISPR-associated protein [Candidatus Tectimicrobiota bacterium]|nr:MAG: CRISPR-associated protein [Candidatus Tectomicrobia bacterium]
MSEPETCRAMLLSLGGSPEPVIYSLNQQQPAYVLFFVSTETAPQIQDVIRALTYRYADSDRLVTPDAEDLGVCYRVLREQLPAKLAQWGVSEETLVVDYTGGTKTMSAALVLATLRRAHRYSYVGGVARDKGGVGVVIGGRERMLRVHNPWREWAEEERQRLRLYWDTARYEIAWRELERLQGHLEPQEQEVMRALASAAAAYCDWDNFRHRDALPKLGQALRFLKPYAQGAGRAALRQGVQEMEANLAFLQQLTRSESRDEAYIADLIANADRRAQREGKYEDAVARLYSALERAARFRLRQHYGIHTEDVSPEQLPEALRAEYAQRYRDPRDGKLKVPLMAAYRLLAALGDPLGQAFMARQDEVVKLLGLRNQSPLGHGEDPVGEGGYRRFRALLMELLGLEEAALPRFAALWA